MKDYNLGLATGVFLGSILGTIGTYFTLKKLKKLDEKCFNEAESKAVNEVKEYYENEIKKLKNLKISGVMDESKKLENEVKNEEKEPKKEENPVITNPKFLYQERLAKEYNDGHKPTDYSKISKVKYTELSKEYEREEPVIEENTYPHLITQDSFEHAGGYVKEEVVYYEQNGIFARLDDDTIVDYLDEQYFGIDNINLFGTPEASLDGKNSLYELYLRDEELHKDYHIIYNGKDDFEHLGDCRMN